MRRLALVIASTAALLVAPASAEQWSFGSGAFVVESLPGYTYARGYTPAYYAGPNGEMAIISVHLPSPQPTREQAAAHTPRLIERFRSRFEDAEVRFGRAVWPVKEQSLPNGEVRLSSVVHIGGPREPEFLLQFAFVSPTAAVAVITIEGRGDAVIAWERFRVHMEAVSWRDAR